MRLAGRSSRGRRLVPDWNCCLGDARASLLLKKTANNETKNIKTKQETKKPKTRFLKIQKKLLTESISQKYHKKNKMKLIIQE